MTVAISGVSGWVPSLRRRTGDPDGTVFTDASLAEYLGDGVDMIEEMYPLGYTTSISGTSRLISSTPTRQAKVLFTTAAEYLVASEKSKQLQANAIVARDGPQSIDTSKALSAAEKAAERAWNKLESLIEDAVYNGVNSGSGAQRINNYDEIDLNAYTESGVKLGGN